MRKIWKKIDHWLAIAIILYVVVGGLIMNIFADELGLVKMSDDPGDLISDCPGDPKWPC